MFTMAGICAGTENVLHLPFLTAEMIEVTLLNGLVEAVDNIEVCEAGEGQAIRPSTDDIAIFFVELLFNEVVLPTKKNEEFPLQELDILDDIYGMADGLP
jgi:hypothetical protein